MEKKTYMKPGIAVAEVELSPLLDNSLTGNGVTVTPGTAEDVDGGAVNSKLQINDVWE